MDAGLVAARGTSYLALLLTAGVPAYALFAGIPILSGSARPAMAALALAALAASAWWALASVAAMTGGGIGELDGAAVLAVLGATPLGLVLEVRAAALGFFIFACFMRPHRFRVPIAALCGAAALASAAWTGHAGASEGAVGVVHPMADALHLLAAATWLGGLAVLLAGQARGGSRREQLRRLQGFATIGTAIVLLLLVTGIANTAAILAPSFSIAVLTGQWAVVLAAKLALFASMLGFAAHNRWRLVPALAADLPGAGRRLERALAGETLAGLAIIALVAVLGVLDPAG